MRNGGHLTFHQFKLNLLVDSGRARNLSPWLKLSSGLTRVSLNNLINNLHFTFDVDVILSYM